MHKKVQLLSKEVKEVKRATMINTVMMAVFVIWSIFKPEVVGHNTATGGSADANISIVDNDRAVLDRAKMRGYFTAKEFAQFEHVNLETIYRRLDAGLITGAEKIDHRWHIPCRCAATK